MNAAALALPLSLPLFGFWPGGEVPFEALASIAEVPIERRCAPEIRGITIAPIEDQRLGQVGYGSLRCEMALDEIAHLGATWIALTPFGRMGDLDSTEVLPDFEIPFAKNAELIRRTAAAARRRGLRVAIIPHIYVLSGRWRGEIDPGSDQAWREWFASYHEFALRYAAVAEEAQADLYSIGVEFKSSSNFWSHEWVDVIVDVRAVFSGSLTYSANWDEAADVPFWSELDAIGINAFWPLGGRPGDGFEVMLDRARAVAAELEALAFHHNRPVVFTEIGVKSATDSALAPWEWPEHCDRLRYDESYQAAAYSAWLEAIADRPWFDGLFIWKYFSDPYDETQEPRVGFSPRGKEAELVLAEWFLKDWRVTLDN